MGWVFHNRINKDGKRAVIYQVYYRGVMFPVSTGVKCKPSSFKKGIIKGSTRQTMLLDSIKTIILKAIDEGKSQLPFWTPEELHQYIKDRMAGHNELTGRTRHFLKEYWEDRIKYYKKANKLDTANHHSNSLKSVFKILHEETYIDQIKKSTLREIVEGLETGRSTSTLNGYFRDLRVIINLALNEEIIQIDPFKGFRLPSMKTRSNAALSWEELQLFKTVKVKTSYQELIRDMAMFRYYCLGMRIKDQLLLTTDNLDGNLLTYTTSKTKKFFSFSLPPECMEIIKKHKKGKKLFPVPGNLTDAHRHMNKSLKRIASYAGIKKSVSTHTFRHTFASINANMNMNDLQNALGHGSAKTTEGYKKSITNQDHLINQTKR